MKHMQRMTAAESRATKALLRVKGFHIRDIHLADGTHVVLVSRRKIRVRAHHHCTQLTAASHTKPKRKRAAAKRRKHKRR